MERIEQYDHVILRDGREGCAVEVFGDQDRFLVDIGLLPEEWDTVDVARDEIVGVIHNHIPGDDHYYSLADG